MAPTTAAKKRSRRPPRCEGLSTGPAEDVTPTAAKLTGSLSPDGTDAHYYFEYGTSVSYGSISPAEPGTNAGTGGAGCEPPGGAGLQRGVRGNDPERPDGEHHLSLPAGRRQLVRHNRR